MVFHDSNFWVKVLKNYFRFIQDVCKKLLTLVLLRPPCFQCSLVLSYSRSCWPRSTQEDCINIRGGLHKYSRYWIESLFEVLDWINIRGIGLYQYSRYWIASIFEVLDWINIQGIGLNHYFRYSGLNQYSRYWIESWKLKDWIEPKILFAIGLNAFLYL